MVDTKPPGREMTLGGTVEIRSVTKEYVERGQMPVRALDGISLSIPSGQFVCVVGPSGCGKTTLLNLVAGFEHPTAGWVEVDGVPVDGPSPARGVVFQDPGALFPWLSVEKNILFGLRNTALPKAEQRERVREVLELIGLQAFAGAFPRQLSGGMRQLVAIARVVVMNPTILLMDEPFAALDAITRQRMQEQLLRIWRARQTTVLFITHSVEEAIYLADRVIVLSERPGRIVADVAVPLPRPRHVTAPEFNQQRALVLQLLGFV